jgi:cellulose synthase operon protein C
MDQRNRVRQRWALGLGRKWGLDWGLCSSLGLGLSVSLGLGLSLSLGLVAPVMAQTVEQGNALFQRGLVNDAIAVYQQVLRQQPQNGAARLGLAIAYQKAGRDADAWTTYQQVLVRDPQNPTALAAVGTLGGYRPEWQTGGIEALTTLLKQPANAGNLGFLAQRALLYSYQGRWAESLADYEQVLPKNPPMPVVLAAAQAYTYSGNPQRGVELFERYLAVGQPLPQSTIIAYARALRETGQAATAVTVLQNAIRFQASPASGSGVASTELQTALAVAYQANGQAVEAERLIADLRTKPAARLSLARSLYAIGQQTQDEALAQEAIALYREALRQTPAPSPGFYAEVADILGQYPASRRDALDLYRQLRQQLPLDVGLTIKHDYLAYRLGEVSRADWLAQVQAVVQPLPPGLANRQLVAQALVSVDPPPLPLLDTYQALVDTPDLNVPFLYFRLAQLHLQANQLADAKTAIAAYSTTPAGRTDRATELLLAEADRRSGNLEASAQRYTQLIATAKGPLQRTATQSLAGIRVAQGQLATALGLYDDLFQRDPTNRAVILGRTSLAYQTQRITLAAAEAVLAEQAPLPLVDPPPELFSLVAALPVAAEREPLYTALLAIDPLNLPVQRRSLQLLARRNPAEARRQMAALISANPNQRDLYLLQAELARDGKDWTTAEQAYAQLLQQQPDNLDVLMALGGLRFEQKRYADAQTLYQRALALNPDSWDVARILAELNLAQDRPFAALQQLRVLEQKQAGAVDPVLRNRIDRISVDRLRRRGFQPDWERY